MPKDSNVVPLTGGRRTPAGGLADTELLRHIISAQGEIGRAGLDPLKVVDVITRRAQELTRSSGAVVEMRDGDDMVYWSASGSVASQVGLRIPVEGSLSGLCVRQGRAIRCDDSETDPRVNRAACRRVGLRSAIAMPLTCNDDLVGVLKVLSPFTQAYGEKDEATLDLLGSFIGAALHHALEHERLRQRHAQEDVAERETRAQHAARRERIEGVLADPARIVPVFQPIIDLTTGAEVGVEGLSRFPRETGGRPDVVFSEAARVGLCEDLELLCATRMLEVLPRLPPSMYVGINLSPATLASPRLDAMLPREIARRVVLEITEVSEVDDYAALTARLSALRARGARLAVDDAGAGFASLRHILRLGPDHIKLDISLTRGIDSSRAHQTLASAMLMFARETSAELVAEGIETEAELATLRELGVKYGQGYLLGRPAPR